MVGGNVGPAVGVEKDGARVGDMVGLSVVGANIGVDVVGALVLGAWVGPTGAQVM
jgi:hypothetical protein